MTCTHSRHTHTHTNTHTHTHTHTNTHTTKVHKHTELHTDTARHTPAQTHRHTHTHTHTHTKLFSWVRDPTPLDPLQCEHEHVFPAFTVHPWFQCPQCDSISTVRVRIQSEAGPTWLRPSLRHLLQLSRALGGRNLL